MRLWSLHPSHLDQKGLVACWREGLLAQAVLLGKTKGYKNHPQLQRFRDCAEPLNALAYYLWGIWLESRFRHYKFDHEKIHRKNQLEGYPYGMTVTTGQLDYERTHLLGKLYERDFRKFTAFSEMPTFLPHPLFDVVDGPVESWEKVR